MNSPYDSMGEFSRSRGESASAYGGKIRTAEVGQTLIAVPISAIRAPKGIPDKYWTEAIISHRRAPSWSEDRAGPIEAQIVNGELRLFDGVHRLGASLRAGKKEVSVKIVE